MSSITWEDLAFVPEGLVPTAQQSAWTAPPNEDPLEHLEKVLRGEEPDAPASLRPPRSDGKSAAFRASVDAYVWAMCRARWPRLAGFQKTQLDIQLSAFREALGRSSGEVEVLTITGEKEEVLKDPLFLNTWLACLNMGHVTDVEERESSVRLVVKR